MIRRRCVDNMCAALRLLLSKDLKTFSVQKILLLSLLLFVDSQPPAPTSEANVILYEAMLSCRNCIKLDCTTDQTSQFSLRGYSAAIRIQVFIVQFLITKFFIVTMSTGAQKPETLASLNKSLYLVYIKLISRN